MKINILLLALILNIGIINACDCSPLKYSEIQKYETENSEYIFIGNVIEIKDDIFKIEVLESFKGKIATKEILIGKNTIDCSFAINETGKWLIYSNSKNGLLKINECGLSRSYKKPCVIPPPPNSNKNQKEYFENQIEILNKEIENLKKSF